MKFTNISRIDSIMSIGVSIFILIHSFKNLKNIIDLFLEKTPNSISIKELAKHIQGIDQIIDVHHIHVWSIDGVNNYATMHVITDVDNMQAVKHAIKEELNEHGIGHITIQFEREDEGCDEEECHVVHTAHAHHHHHHHH